MGLCRAGQPEREIKLTSNPPSGVAAALREYQAGRLAEAERLLMAMMPREQQHPSAQYLLGMIALQSNRHKEAVSLLHRAASAEPKNHVFRSNLALALNGLGDRAAAIQELEQAIAIKPDYVAGFVNLGVIQLESDRPEAACAAFQRASRLAPANAAAKFGLGNAHKEMGRLDLAADFYRAAIQLEPNHVEAHNNLGNTLAELEEWEGALAALDRACSLRPTDPRLKLNFAAKLEAAGRQQDAIAILDQLLTSLPDNEEVLVARLRLAWRMADASGMTLLVDRLSNVSGGKAQVWAEKAYVLEAMHRLVEARAAAERALAIDPDSAAALLVLAKVERRDGNLAAARRGLEATLTKEELPEAANDLGQLLDELGETDAAMALFVRAKAAYGRQSGAKRSRPEKYVELVRDVRAYVATGRAEHWPKEIADVDRPSPIFFVGFPRSGTTLMEQMLANHPDLMTAEEKPLLSSLRAVTTKLSRTQAPYPRSLDDLPPEAVVQLRSRYWSGVDRWRGASTDSRRFVDKLPLNITHLVLARRMFPDAPVLVALRDPRDVVLSCYMQDFQPNDAMANLLTLDGAASFYAEVMGLWLECRARLGLRCHEYRYEELIASPRQVLMQIVDFLQIGWNDAMLDHVSRARSALVRTPSYGAVARPLSEHAIGRWRRYRQYLGEVERIVEPFVAAFGYPRE